MRQPRVSAVGADVDDASQPSMLHPCWARKAGVMELGSGQLAKMDRADCSSPSGHVSSSQPSPGVVDVVEEEVATTNAGRTPANSRTRRLFMAKPVRRRRKFVLRKHTKSTKRHKKKAHRK